MSPLQSLPALHCAEPKRCGLLVATHHEPATQPPLRLDLQQPFASGGHLGRRHGARIKANLYVAGLSESRTTLRQVATTAGEAVALGN
jgi:hypothetical protein